MTGVVGAALALACSGAAQGKGDGAGEDPAFSDVTLQAGITHVHHKPDLDPKVGNIMNWLASVGAAVAAADYDGDGDIDLYVTDSRTGYPNYLYRNDGGFHFTELARQAGVARVNDSHGTSMDAVFGDVDNDGDLDLLITANNGSARLLRNDGGNRNHMLRVKTVGTTSNRDGIGTRVRVTMENGKTQWALVRTGSSYLSQSELALGARGPPVQSSLQ